MALSPQEELQRLAAENLQLHDAVTKQKNELKHKNRELEIEAALERVRTCAMAMQKPEDMLSVCRVIFQQLEILRVKNIRNVQTIILNDPRDSFTNYEYFNLYDKESIIEVPYAAHPIITDFVHQIKSSDDYFFYSKIEGESLTDWRHYLKTGQEKVDPRLESATALIYYMYSIGPGALGVSMYDTPMPDEDVVVLKRFRNVFQLAYRRYSDIEQAEAQAREARIEAALEKVRAVAMSMHVSEDLLNVCEVLYQQLQSLSFSNIRNAIINIHDDAKRSYTNYDFSDAMGKTRTPFTYDVHPVIEKQIREIRSANDAFSETVFEGQDLEDWKEFRRRKGEQDDPRIENSTSLHYYLYSIGTGSIGISTFNAIDAEKLDLLKRFRNVFTLSYQRYLDIALAEAQAREAQIQLGLERVRARTMAMQRSEEMVEASHVLFNELNALGIEAIRTGVATVDAENETVTVWSSQLVDKNDIKILGIVPKNAHPFFDGYLIAWKKKEPFFSFSMTGDEVKSYYTMMSSILSYPLQTEFNPKEIFQVFFFPEGSLNVITHEPLSEESCELLVRFARVFGLIYRRFLDLKQAEYQAKEANIEASLERVRATAMIMRKPEELSTVGEVIFTELKSLGFADLRNTEIIINQDKKESVVSYYYSDYGVTGVIELSYQENPIIKKWALEMKSAVDAFSKIEILENEIVAWRAYREQIGYQPDPKLDTATSVYYYSYSTGLGALSISTFAPISDEQMLTIQRFRNVFGLAYRRYVDVTQAEVQAREAKIELALERVRARTMAMQRSDELSETAQILFQQFKELGETPIQITIGIFNEEEGVIDFNVTDWGGAGNQIGQRFKASIDEPTLMHKIYKAWKANQKSIVVDLTGQELLDWVAYRNALSGTADHQFKLHDRRTVHVGLFSKGLLSFSTHEPRPAESVNVLERFASVFDQTYTRFLDLKQAEAQAKESQIQLALERVRARTMAMQRSDELKNAAALLFQQIKALGVPAYSCGYNIWEKGETEFTSWMSTQDGSIINGVPNIPLTEDANFIRYVKSKQSGEEFFVLELRGERMQEHYEYLKTIPAFKAFFEYAISVGFNLPETQIHHLANFSNGNLLFITLEPCPEFYEVFKRFAAVFEQTYTRFLDLQKAEAQTREAQIEAALEKVRSRSLAVHQSEEFKEVIHIVFEKLEDLGFKVDTASINIFIEGSKDTDVYACGHNEDGLDIRRARLRYFDHPIANDLYNVHQNGLDFFVGSYGKEEKNSYNTYQFEHGDLKELPDEIKEKILETEHYSLSMAPTKHSVIILNNVDGKLLSETEIDIVKRFARVFEQAYTRFLDLQKAEAQTREAQIETALEKVRSRSLAMHKSDEIQDVLHAVFERMKELNLDFFSATIIIFQEGTRDMEWWLANKMNQQYRRMAVKYTDVPLFKKLFAAKEGGVELFSDSYSFEEKNKLFNYFFEHTDFRHTPEEQKKFILSSESLSLSIGLTRNIAIQISNYSLKQFSEKENEILLRFTKVFDQAYTRFLDLQKAEAQARESQIEAALERVRSRTMGMQKSEELKEVIQVVFDQFVQLNMHVEHTGFVMDYKERDDYDIWVADPLGVPAQVIIPYFDCEYYNRFNEAKEKGEDFFATRLNFEDKNKFYQTLFEYVPGLPEESKRFYFSCPGLAASTVLLENIGLYIENFSGTPYTDEENAILMRFGKVFQQTYTRFLDLKKAEAQARESQIEAGLERVRSRTLAMQNSDELAETAAVLFRQLIGLGIAPTRLYIGIVQDDSSDIEMWATDEDGSTVNTQFTGKIDRSPVIYEMYDGWKAKLKSKTIDLQGKELSDYFKYLSEELQVPFRLGLDQKRRVQTIAYFSKGLIGIASPDPQPEETTMLLERFASVFNLTFTRFNDLKIAEHHAEQAREDLIKLQIEKKRAEEALTELRATQTQLIQSEKMASLGELTAGIAHEIQNPLNFVNNFSEVNTELIDELNDELANGNLQLAKEIAGNIKDNEEKIVFHGKRADAIVKGMLQHSRSSSGVKEPTDINALADEYLRLAYHGLRAKDKSFNATMKTDFDPNIGLINVVPQDIGRVILNLITNAFYAVSTSHPLPPGSSPPLPPIGGKKYEPTVAVTTRRLLPPVGGKGGDGNPGKGGDGSPDKGDRVEISVKDNGPGIPQNILDKIFQPFFTTKPTGQGTGLGLSLSYDIIKAHGGELKVETRTAEGLPVEASAKTGTTFIILLPA